MKHVKPVFYALLIVPAIVLLAFGPSSVAPVPRGRVIVDYWEKWTGTEGAQMKQIVDDFNNTAGREKNIFVRFVSTADIEQKTLVATAGGVPPDIAGLYDGNLDQYAAMGALMPLDDLAAHADPPITAQTYKPIYWEGCHYKNHLYALISTPADVALHYNVKLMRENAVALRAAGLDPDHPPRSIDELDQYSLALEHRNAQGNLDRAGYLPTVPGWYTNQTFFWFGASIWDAGREKFTLTDPAVLKAFDWVQSYSRRLGAKTITDFKSGLGGFDTPQNEFMAGQVVMEQQGPWMANFIYNQLPAMDGLKPGEIDDPSQPLAKRRARMDWAVAPFPSADPALHEVTYCAFDTLVIPVGARHPKEAFDFIAYINRQDVMEKLCNLHSKNSPLAKVSDAFLNHSKNPYIDVFEKLARSPNARILPQVPIWTEVDDELTNAIDRIALLKATPLEALTQAQERLQKHYDLFAARQRQREAERK